MAFHHSPRIVSDQLVFSWDIPNKKSYPGSGASITNLISGAENLIINNATIQSGSSNGNGSVVMDGSGDYLSFSDTTFSNTMTFSIWHKARRSDGTSSDPFGYGYLFSKNGGTSFGLAFSEGGTNSSISLSPGNYYFYNGSSSTVISTAVGQDQTWGNIVVVFNKTANEIKFYFNGVLNQTSSVTLSSVDMVFNQFGRYQASNWYLIGELAACYIYNKELSAAEVLQNYNALKGRFG